MDEENSIGFVKYVLWIISALTGLFVWVGLLVLVDDTGMWHFEYASVMADFMRLGIIVGAGCIASAVGFGINLLLTKFFSRNTDVV